MVVTLVSRKMVKKIKVFLKVIILATILLYILPKLVSMLWYIHYPQPKIREDHLLEKPLRVIPISVYVS